MIFQLNKKTEYVQTRNKKNTRWCTRHACQMMQSSDWKHDRQQVLGVIEDCSLTENENLRYMLHVYMSLNISTVSALLLNNLRLLRTVHACSALTLLVGQQKGHPACKNWMTRYWRGNVSGVRCKWFAYGPADATATPPSLAPVKSRMVYLSGASLPRLSWKKGR